MQHLNRVKSYAFIAVRRLKSYGWTLVIVGGLFRYLLPSSSSQTLDTSKIEVMTVGSGTLNKTISAQGKVSIPGMLQLSFTKDGVVNQIFKQEKDQVKAGDIIAQLDTTQAQISLQQAQTNLELAKTKLSELLLGPDASATTQLSNDIDQSKLSLDTIDVQLDAIQTEKQGKKAELQLQLNQLSGEIATARLEYQTALAQSGTTLTDTLSSYASQIRSAIQSYQSSKIKLSDFFDTMDYLFGVTDKYKQSRDRLYLGAKDLGSLNTNQQNLLVLMNRYKELNDMTLPASIDAEVYDISALKEQYNTLLLLLKDIQARTPGAYAVVTNSVVASNFSEQTIDGYKTSITQQNSSLDSSFNNLQNNYNQLLAIKSRQDTINDATTSLENKKNAVNKVLTQYVQTRNQLNQLDSTYQQQLLVKQAERAKQSGQITVNQQKLQENSDGPTSQAVRQQQLQIQLQQLALQQAQNNLKDYQIIAPFDGIIEKIDFKTKEQLQGTKKYVTITNPDRYQIDVNLDQVDIVYIRPGQSVSIVLSSFPSTTLSGVVDQIYRIPVTENNAISYTVSISFVASGMNLFQDMYGSVSFDFHDQAQKGLKLIPLKAIQYDTGSSIPYVWIQQGTSYTKRPVSVGQTDGLMIQISSGVVLGDRVVVSPYVPQTVETRRFGPGGGGPR